MVLTATRWSRRAADGLTDGSMARALGAMVAAIVAAGIAAWVSGTAPAFDRPMLPVTGAAAAGWAMLVAATGAMVFFHRSRVLALVLVGIVGLMVSAAFVHLSAPDLALTQILIETVTLVAFALVLRRIPSRMGEHNASVGRIPRALLAIGVGVTMAFVAVVATAAAVSADSVTTVSSSSATGAAAESAATTAAGAAGFAAFGALAELKCR